MALASSSEPEPAAAPVVALIPGYNEGPRIAAVVRGALEHLPVIVVDDGSRDDTADRAREAGATVIEQRPNAGKGAALRAGFRRALEGGYDAVLTLDADGQHDPAEIPKFLAAFATEPRPDLVIGRRNFRAMPPIRRLSNTLGGKAFSWAVGREIPDNQSGYRLIGRRVLESTIDSDEGGFEFEVEMITTCIRLGGTIAWVPIRTIYAGAPSHIRPIDHLRSFIRITRRARRDVRLPIPTEAD
ncbi:MAG TPA: glycosyltransferase family 2 protein [Candidatus Limnocylindrales bacterium]|nr:glycosyltransferase family 2 protein [Candidatus Limnocylindrales bacterium]